MSTLYLTSIPKSMLRPILTYPGLIAYGKGLIATEPRALSDHSL